MRVEGYICICVIHCQLLVVANMQPAFKMDNKMQYSCIKKRVYDNWLCSKSHVEIAICLEQEYSSGCLWIYLNNYSFSVLMDGWMS